jgi:hypothetical protein
MYNFDFNQDFSNYSTDKLQEMISECKEKHSELYLNKKNSIKNLINTYIVNIVDGDFASTYINIKFKSDKRNLNINIYYGIDRFMPEKEFKFEINPSCLGGFDILGDSIEKDYYTAIGIILTNLYFQRELLMLLKMDYDEMTTISDDIYIIQQEIIKREAEIIKQEKKTQMIENFKETYNQIKAYDKSGDVMFVAFKYLNGNNLHMQNGTYRNKPIQIMPYGVDEWIKIKRAIFENIVESGECEIKEADKVKLTIKY